MRQRLLPLFLLVPLCLAAAPVAVAKDEPAPAAKSGGGEKKAAQEGIDIFAPRFDLAIWTIVVFLCLFFILKKYAWGPMLEGLQKREENIHAALEEAKKAREEAQVLRAQLQKEMEQNAQKMAALMEEARREAQQLKEAMKAETTKEIQTERERLRREIEIARDQALQELWNRSAELATLIAAKAIRRQLSIDDHRRLVDEALRELKDAGSQRQREIASI
jgi:F-type H+-transporting ATPase subunit b